MSRYRILEADSLYDLENKVNDALQEGWKLVGGPTLSFQEDARGWYMQAMEISGPERPVGELNSVFGGGDESR